MSPQSQRPSIDVHTHIGVDYGFFMAGWWPYGATVQDLVERLDRYGIDKAVCFPFVTSAAFDPYAFARDRTLKLHEGRFPFDHENPHLLNEIEWLDLADRLLPLAFFDPGRKVAEQLRALEPIADRFAGLKAQTEVLRSPIRNVLDEARGFLELAREHNLPVLLHTAVNPNDQCAQVADCLDVAEAWPDVRFNLAHSLRFDRAGLERAATLPNVWVDCSAHIIHCRLAVGERPSAAPADRRVDADYTRPAQVIETIHAMLGDRYMWGSDAPFNSWCDDSNRLVSAYGDEIAVLDELPAPMRQSMLRDAPHAWLYGERGAEPEARKR